LKSTQAWIARFNPGNYRPLATSGYRTGNLPDLNNA